MFFVYAVDEGREDKNRYKHIITLPDSNGILLYQANGVFVQCAQGFL